MVAGLEVRLIEEFIQDAAEPENRSQDTKRHDQSASVQTCTAFLINVQSVIRMMEDFRNSFEEDSQDLLVLDTKEIAAPPGDVDAVRRAHKVGQVQFDNFARERLVERTKPIVDAIHRNKLKIFSQHASKPQAKGKQQMQSFKNDVDLLSALRRVPEPGWEIGNLDEFFQTKSAPCAVGWRWHPAGCQE